MRVMMGRESIEIFEKQDLGTPYTLTVMNENPKFQSYALFQTIPDVVGASQSPVVSGMDDRQRGLGQPGKPEHVGIQLDDRLLDQRRLHPGTGFDTQPAGICYRQQM